MSSKINHLEQLCVFQVDFDIWSGQTRLSPDDFKLGTGGEIPPEKVAQLGTKKICDPAKLKGFHRLKSDTRRSLLRYGIPFMNGFALPQNRCEEMILKLDAVEAEFKNLKADFINGYHNAIDEWCRENPQYATALRAGALPLATVEKRIGFEYQVIKIGPVDVGNDAVSERLSRKVNGLGDELIADLIEEADKFYSERLAGRDKCGITTRMTLRNMRDKLDGLSFLNSKIQPLVKLLDETLDGYTKYAVGREVHAPFFHQVVAAVLILSSKTQIDRYLEGAVSVQGIASGLQTDPDLQVPSVQAGGLFAEPGIAAAAVDVVGSSQSDVSDDSSVATSAVDLTAEMDAMLDEIRQERQTPIENPVEVLDRQVTKQDEPTKQTPVGNHVIDVESRVIERSPEKPGTDSGEIEGNDDESQYF